MVGIPNWRCCPAWRVVFDGVGYVLLASPFDVSGGDMRPVRALGVFAAGLSARGTTVFQNSFVKVAESLL